MRLTDCKVRIVNSSSGTAAVTRVLIESGDGVSTWTTIGVHENIIEASLQALVDSLSTACSGRILRPAIAPPLAQCSDLAPGSVHASRFPSSSSPIRMGGRG